MHIIVVGCGLAGLTVAIALQKGGHTVEILESAPAISYIGAGIQVSPNSSRILRKLGVDRYIEKYCTEPIDLKMMRWENGQVLVECPLKQPAHEEYESPYWHIHRADLHRGLLEYANELGIVTHLDSRVLEVDAYAPALTVKGGKRFAADLIVASDGLHSMCRHIVLGSTGSPIPTGQMVYRVTLPAKKLEGMLGLEDFIKTPRNNHWIGPRGTILSYLLEGYKDKLVNLVFTCDVDMPDGTLLENGVDQRKGTSEEVRKAFKGWDPRIDMMLEHVTDVLLWRLYTHKELPSWVHDSGKMCLIGDAAHAMTPYLAQGAAMGIEDSAILGGLLERYPEKETLHETLRLYEKLRLKRSAKVAAASIDSRHFTQIEDGPAQEERDRYLLDHPGICKDHINIRSRKEFLDELFGYDAYAELEKACTKQQQQPKIVANNSTLQDELSRDVRVNGIDGQIPMVVAQ